MRDRATGRRGAGRGTLGIFLLIAVALAACGDDGTGPVDEVEPPEFPTLDALVATEFCVRGTLIPGETVAGEVSDENCPTINPVGVGPERFFESWRVRVGRSGSVTLEVSSDFDTFLDLFRIDDLSEPGLSTTTLVAFNDDDGADENGLLTVTLQAGTEYWAIVSGFNPEDVGTYSLEAR